ncbi:HlyD family type I secretion periplasmic adaptor subunit [Roseibium aggregatum]|uniref:HlyD family type I secretion periplasmic adaptor subunit n=1 Tax=Roseibium aggregatum TaxID=187304 RepID=UPI00094AAE13|nr:HlyD family type I secretion periplasmic adaptor subunit [Roseibium aggregatum]UFI05725.1 HlyD family type I secretion periplasmic adaptor subunit [Roseibium aggregatum]
MKATHLDSQFELNDGKAVRLTNMAAAVIGICLVLFIAWAVATPVDEVAKARGVIEPVSEVQRLQSEHGGALATLVVRKGGTVAKGDVIAIFDNSELKSELREAQTKSLALTLERERLLAIVETRTPEFQKAAGPFTAPPDLIAVKNGTATAPSTNQRTVEELINREMAAFEARVAFLSNEKDVINRQIAEKAADVWAIDSEQPAIERQLTVAREETESLRDLVDRGLAARPQLVAAVQEEARYEYELSTLSGRRAVAEAQISELQENLERVGLNEASEARQRIAEIHTERSALEEQMQRIQRRLWSTELRSPVDGFVQSVPETIVGRVIEPGGLVAEIVPRDVDLRFTAQLPPRDVGFVSIGQPAKLKVDSFDFSRYGSLTGKVVEVSPTTIVDERGTAYYEVLVSVPVTHFGDDPGRYSLLPGMTGEADILTGKKTVFEYIWKPIYTNLDLALSER